MDFRWQSLAERGLSVDEVSGGPVDGRCSAAEVRWIGFKQAYADQAILSMVAGSTELPDTLPRAWVPSEDQAAVERAHPRAERRDDGDCVVFSHVWCAVETALDLSPGSGRGVGLALLAGGGEIRARVRGSGSNADDPVYMGACVVAAFRKGGFNSTCVVWRRGMSMEAVGEAPRTLRLRVPPGLGTRVATAGERMKGVARAILLIRVAGRDAEHWRGHFGTRLDGVSVAAVGPAPGADAPMSAHGCAREALVPSPRTGYPLARAMGVRPIPTPAVARFSDGQGAGGGLWLRGRRLSPHGGGPGAFWTCPALACGAPALAWHGASGVVPPAPGSAGDDDALPCPLGGHSLLRHGETGPLLCSVRQALPDDGDTGTWTGGASLQVAASLPVLPGAPGESLPALSRLFRVGLEAGRATTVRLRWVAGPLAPVPVLIESPAAGPEPSAGAPSWAVRGGMTARLPAVAKAVEEEEPVGGSPWAAACFEFAPRREGGWADVALCLALPGAVGAAAEGAAAEGASALRVGEILVTQAGGRAPLGAPERIPTTVTPLAEHGPEETAAAVLAGIGHSPAAGGRWCKVAWPAPGAGVVEVWRVAEGGAWGQGVLVAVCDAHALGTVCWVGAGEDVAAVWVL